MDIHRKNYLAQYFDPDLTPPKATQAELEADQVKRITRALSVVLYAGGIPRRLGGDASDEELATDRKRARRVAHALKQSIRGWAKKMPDLPTDEELRVEGAQIVWDTWAQAYIADLNLQLRTLVTWSVRQEQERWGRSAIVKLENEINWLTYAMRD